MEKESASPQNRLSRNALYTALAQSQHKDKLNVNELQSRFHKSSQPPSTLSETGRLTTFLSRVSYYSHREFLDPSAPRNNGGRPLDKSTTESRISQKALTLLGGQFSTSVLSRQRPNSKLPRKRRPRKRQVSSKEVRGLFSRKRKTLKDSHIGLLKRLNAGWNEYVGTLLRTLQRSHTVDDEKVPVESICLKLFQEVPVDLVGARVEIVRSSIEHVLNGILVRHTPTHWTVAAFNNKLPQTREKPTQNVAAEVIVQSIPKNCAILRLSLPLENISKISPSSITGCQDNHTLITITC